MPAWTLKYRPSKVSELHHRVIREQLLSFMKNGKIPQVLLFTGPKGIGKTSASRIIAAVLNDAQNQEAVKGAYFQNSKKKIELNEPDSSDPLIQKIIQGSAFAVQELDAASNRGINEVRALKERIQLLPTQGSMAVYILDEAHMLTTPAFNALLKILEEPPAHVIFILATTEIQKIPATILSRCQVLRFTKASRAEIIDALKPIIKAEKLEISQELLEQISDLADGSFRDAVKLLEQVAVNQSHSEQNQSLSLFPAIEQSVSQLIDSIIQKDAPAVSQLFVELRSLAIDESYLVNHILKYLHACLLQGLKISTGESPIPHSATLFLLKSFNHPIANLVTPIPLISTELLSLEIIDKATKQAAQKQGQQSQPPKSQLPKSPPPTPVSLIKNNFKEAQVSSSANTEISQITETVLPISTKQGDGQKLLTQWGEFVTQLGQLNTRLATLFCSIKPVLAEANVVTLAVYYKFHQEQLTQPQIIRLIEDVASELSGGLIQFEFRLEEPPSSRELDFNAALIS